MKVIGKFIAGSGLPNILTDSEILANGSVGSFLSGKHFNRCRKIHPLLSLALQILHFKRFLNSNEFDLEIIRNPLLQFNKQSTSSPRMSDDTLLQLFEKYEKFKNDNLEGKKGKTAQIFFMYVKLVDYYLMLDFSIRNADLELFKYVLQKMTNLFLQ